MTWVLPERDLEISIDGASSARKFDEQATHRVGFMKAVDFVVEYPDRYLFIEFKDPQQPGSDLTGDQDLIDYYQSENIDDELIYKCRDSFLYEWAAGRAKRCLLPGGTIEPTVDKILQTWTEEDLDRKLPVGVPSVWQRAIVRGCGVFNLASWNDRFPELQVRRLSAS